MYAIVLIGSRQHKLCKGDIVEVEKLATKKKSGEISLDKVLLYSKGHHVEIGYPFVKNIKVIAEIVGQAKSKKVISFKYRRRKGRHWKKGFRKQITKLKIKEIIAK